LRSFHEAARRLFGAVRSQKGPGVTVMRCNQVKAQIAERLVQSTHALMTFRVAERSQLMTIAREKLHVRS